MYTKDDKIKELIRVMSITKPIMELTMKTTGCDGQYAEKAPIDYSTMVGLYKELTENFLFESINEIIENEEMLDKIITMHKSEEYLVFENMIEKISQKGNPFTIAANLAGDLRVPESFLRFISIKLQEQRKSINSKIENLGDDRVRRIQIGSPEELKEIVNVLKKIGGDNIQLPPDLEEALKSTDTYKSPEEELEDSIKELRKSIGFDSEDYDCAECDANDCASRDKPPKGTQIN